MAHSILPDGASRPGQQNQRDLLGTLVIACHLLKNKISYSELGGDYFDRIRADGLKRYYLKRLTELGVIITPQTVTSPG